MKGTSAGFCRLVRTIPGNPDFGSSGREVLPLPLPQKRHEFHDLALRVVAGDDAACRDRAPDVRRLEHQAIEHDRQSLSHVLPRQIAQASRALLAHLERDGRELRLRIDRRSDRRDQAAFDDGSDHLPSAFPDRRIVRSILR